MTFGEVKSIIEESLIESYKDQKNFKKVMNEFHHNVLTNKSISKLYSLYDDLTFLDVVNDNGESVSLPKLVILRISKSFFIDLLLIFECFR